MSGTITGVWCDSFSSGDACDRQHEVTLKGVDANDLVGSLDDRLRREVLAEYFNAADLDDLRQALLWADKANVGSGLIARWRKLHERILELQAEGDAALRGGVNSTAACVAGGFGRRVLTT